MVKYSQYRTYLVSEEYIVCVEGAFKRMEDKFAVMIHPKEQGREVIEPLEWKRESLLHT